jgi:hypothetical protein
MHRRKHWGATLTFVAALAHPEVLFAQGADATSDTSAVSDAKLADQWQRRYQQARERLLARDFERARIEFAALASAAPDAPRAALARELASLSAGFQAHGQAGALEPSSAAGDGQRTTDELSWLYLTAVAYGLGTGGWLAVQTEPDSAAGGILPALGLAGAAAAAVAFADSRDAFAYGVPQSITTGLTLGVAEGAAWAVWNQSRVRAADEWEDKMLATVIWGASTLGAVAGGAVGALAGTTPGRASMVGSSGIWTGVLSGLAVASLSGNAADERDDRALLAGALGLNVGAVAGAILAGPVSPSIARVRFMDLGGIAGGLLAGGIYVSATDGFKREDDGQERGLYATTALGIAAGLGAATYLTRTMPADRGASRRRHAAALRAEPTLLPVSGGMALGASGSF